MATTIPEPDVNNVWRTETPGNEGWVRSARPDANDFPHHEGSWPYSAQAIERTMSHLDDGERAKILGLNAARIFGFEIPKRYLHHPDAAAVAARR